MFLRKTTYFGKTNVCKFYLIANIVN